MCEVAKTPTPTHLTTLCKVYLFQTLWKQYRQRKNVMYENKKKKENPTLHIATLEGSKEGGTTLPITLSQFFYDFL